MDYKEAISLNKKEYYIKNKERIIVVKKKYYENNKTNGVKPSVIKTSLTYDEILSLYFW